MPGDAPAVKTDGVRALGARLVPYDRNREDREEITERLRRESGAALVKPYDSAASITGQGTAGWRSPRNAAISALRRTCCYAPAAAAG